MLPRLGEPWLPGKPYRDRPGVYAVIRGRRPGWILCVRQGAELQLPGGGIDPGESPLAALHREVLEETAHAIAPGPVIARFQRFAYLPDYGYWARKVQTVYLARAVARRDIALEPDHQAVWLPAREAVARLGVEGDRVVLATLLSQG
ncbi:MAG: NUDIX domain-containing protein [Pseudomonadota bacterium]